MSVAQAAATLAATVIGYNIGLYGSDVVNAVMVVVAVSLIVTSIGTNRFARQIPPPVDERRRAGETILVPVLDELDGLKDVLRLGQDLADPAGGLVQPLVPVTSVRKGRHRPEPGEAVRGRPGPARARGRRGDDAAGQPVGVQRTEPGGDRDRRIAAAAGMARPR
jgi:hypothetical protein